MKKGLKAKSFKTRSRFEQKIVNWLTSIGAPFEYEPFRIKFTRPPSHYTPDIVLPNGKIIEIKGLFDSADRAKHLLLQKQHPNLNVHFVFQNKNKRLNKKSSTTYANWCEQHGFVYAQGDIPLDWLK